MDKRVFRTDKLTLSGYILLVLIYATFFGMIVYRSTGLSFKSLIMVLLIIPIVAYLFFLFKKKVVIDNDCISIWGLTGKKEFKWNDISDISLSSGRRQFLFITDKKGNVAVVDDSTDNFKELLEELKKRLPEDQLPEHFEDSIKAYKRSYMSLALVYLASLILLSVLIKSMFR